MVGLFPRLFVGGNFSTVLFFVQLPVGVLASASAATGTARQLQLDPLQPGATGTAHDRPEDIKNGLPVLSPDEMRVKFLADPPADDLTEESLKYSENYCLGVGAVNLPQWEAYAREWQGGVPLDAHVYRNVVWPPMECAYDENVLAPRSSSSQVGNEVSSVLFRADKKRLLSSPLRDEDDGQRDDEVPTDNDAATPSGTGRTVQKPNTTCPGTETCSFSQDLATKSPSVLAGACSASYKKVWFAWKHLHWDAHLGWHRDYNVPDTEGLGCCELCVGYWFRMKFDCKDGLTCVGGFCVPRNPRTVRRTSTADPAGACR